MNGESGGLGSEGAGTAAGPGVEGGEFDKAKWLEAAGLPPYPNLQEQYDKDLMATETERLKAEAELEQSKKEFLEAQIGKVDPAKIDLAKIMEKADRVAAPIPWILIGIGAFLIFGKNLFK